MEYRIINGKVMLPTAKEAKESYKNGCRKLIIEAIEKANDEGENFTIVENIDEWLILELKEQGYKVEKIVYNKGPIPSTYNNYEISWSE
ncbi:hypothetical protein [uncultured Clostridium sp.]|uniref:hypothetical protein n=1 Tax=uncultured Clostridium sp. TaxID=59620 RepID=UPI0026162CC8|nr:hypothetical protein [uncultured Clostridium sp.]